MVIVIYKIGSFVTQVSTSNVSSQSIQRVMLPFFLPLLLFPTTCSSNFFRISEQLHRIRMAVEWQFIAISLVDNVQLVEKP